MMKSSGHVLLSASRISRLVYVIAAIFVVIYIAFDVLDLDLSNFPLNRTPRQRLEVVTQTPKAVELVNLCERSTFSLERLLPDPSISRDSIRLNHKGGTVLMVRAARTHILKLTLPRSSPPESSPAA